MADWTVRHNGERILEPSFGDGIFLRAVAGSAMRKGFASVRLSGIEINEKALTRAYKEHLTTETDLRIGDFLGVPPSFKVEASNCAIHRMCASAIYLAISENARSKHPVS